MLLKMCSFMLLLMPFLSPCQAQSGWKLYMDKKQIASANGDSVQTVQVHKNANTSLKFVLAAGDTAFLRKIIVMNNRRNGISSQKITANTNEAVFDIQELYQQSKGKDLTFYTVKLPADPAKAALVRVAPIAICNLQWIE